MKTKILSLLAVVLFIQVSRAQVWCAPGATWQYYIRGSFPVSGPFGTHQVSFSNTLTAVGRSWDHLHGVVQGTFGTSPWNNQAQIDFNITESNGLVLYDSGQHIDTLADLNAIPGDGWYDNWDTDTIFSKRVVVDTGHVMVGSQSRRALFFDNLHTNAFIQGIGYNFGFFIPYKWYLSGASDNYQTHGTFKCFSDDQIGTYKTDASWSCSKISLGLKEINKPAFSVYPNPTTGTLYVDAPVSCELRVISLSGQLIKKIPLSRGRHTVDVSVLAKGMYLLELRGEEAASTSRLIVN